MMHDPTSEDAALAELRRLYADLQEDGYPCDDESLVRLVLGEAEEGERQRLADRVVLSRETSERYRTLVELHRATSAKAAASRRARRLRAMAAAAVVLLAVAAAVLWKMSFPGSIPPEGDPLRSPLDEAVRPVNGAVLAVPPTAMQWSAQAMASGYRVRLFDAEARLLWSGDETAEPHLQLPEEVVSAFAEGDSYMWTVDVGGAVQRRRLGPFWFTIESAAERP